MIDMGPDVWAIFLGKVNRCAQELTDGYGDLQELVAPRRSAGGGCGSRDPFPQAPLNLDVVDLIGEVDRESDRLRDTVREVLGMGGRMVPIPRPYMTVSSIEFAAKAVPSLWGTHLTVGEDVVDTLWRLSGAVKRRTSTGGPYLSERPCTKCLEPTVMVDPGRARSRCATCGDTRHATDAIRP